VPAGVQYHWLARHYDDLFAGFREPLDNARAKLLKCVLPHVRIACDAACGTGSTAIKLAKLGIRMYAFDAAALMCRVAREKARRENVRLRVLRRDLQDFALPEQVDLITCEGDAMNHLQKPSDLNDAARAAYRALRPGGYFYFDVNNAAGFRSYWRGNVWLEQPGIVLVMRNGNDAATNRAWSDVELFLKQGKAWLRHQERIDEVCWEPAEIRQVLNRTGFEAIKHFDAEPFFRPNPVIKRGCRSFWLARKPAAK